MTFVTLPDGTSTRLKRFKLSPIVLDGSKILVGQKKEYEPFSPTEFVSTYTIFLSELVQAWLMVTLATKQ